MAPTDSMLQILECCYIGNTGHLQRITTSSVLPWAPLLTEQTFKTCHTGMHHRMEGPESSEELTPGQLVNRCGAGSPA